MMAKAGPFLAFVRLAQRFTLAGTRIGGKEGDGYRVVGRQPARKIEAQIECGTGARVGAEGPDDLAAAPHAGEVDHGVGIPFGAQHRRDLAGDDAQRFQCPKGDRSAVATVCDKLAPFRKLCRLAAVRQTRRNHREGRPRQLRADPDQCEEAPLVGIRNPVDPVDVALGDPGQ